jgi:hypothetical protein
VRVSVGALIGDYLLGPCLRSYLNILAHGHELTGGEVSEPAAWRD